MKKFLVLVAIALSMGFTACDDEDDAVVKPVVSIISDSDDNSVAQLDTLRLQGQMENGVSARNYVWTLNGQEVSTSSSYKFTQAKPGEYTIGLTMTDGSGEKIKSEIVAKVYARFGKGTFVLNEGNMTDETGTLTFIDSNNVLLDSVYYRVNNSLLGNTSQDLFIADGKIYIIAQNGAKNGGEGILTVANAESLEKEAVYNAELESVDMPTHVAVVGSDVYIRGSYGVFVLNTSTKELTEIDNTRGFNKNRMVVFGDEVFAMDGKNICVLKNKEIVKTIELPGSLSGIAKAYDGNLWASCTSPNQIVKINPSDYSIIETHDLAVGIGNNWGAAPAFSAKGDTLYFCNGSSTLYRHIFTQNETETVVENMKEFLPDAKTYYNSLGVNPESGEVIMATLKGWGQDYKINDIAIFDFTKTPALQHDYKGKNSFPAGVYFTYNFQ